MIAGARRIFDVVEMPTRAGSAGIGVDFTELENLKAEMARMIDAHRRTLDQLATGVAIFGADQTLRFYNEAYRTLWDLDASYLDHSPTDSAVLDRLRAARKLPRTAGLPLLEEPVARSLSRARSERRPLAPTGRTDAARRHDAEYRRRRDLPVRQRHRTARSRTPL